MPDAFLNGGQRKVSSSSSASPKKHIPTWVVVTALVVVLLIAVAVGALVLRNAVSDDNTNVPVVGNYNTNTNTKVNENINSDANTNINQNTNANRNANANTNSDNTNTNANANANTNQNTNSNRNSNTNRPSDINIPLPPSSRDADDDDLTDKEDALYRTDAKKPDTDGDGFYDGEEVLNGYDPTVVGGKLSSSVVGKIYRNTEQEYTAVYPAAFTIGDSTPKKTEILFTADTGEFIGVTIAENPSSLSSAEWYADQLGTGVKPAQLTSLTIGGKDAVYGIDQHTAYVADGTRVIVMQYNFGVRSDMNFYTTFQMMLKEFAFTR